MCHVNQNQTGMMKSVGYLAYRHSQLRGTACFEATRHHMYSVNTFERHRLGAFVKAMDVGLSTEDRGTSAWAGKVRSTMNVKRWVGIAGIAALVMTAWSTAGADQAVASTPSRVPSHSESPHTVPLNCTSWGGDSRTTADASVQPGIIVADPSGWPYSPVTYTPYTVEPGGQLQPIGPFNTLFTTDHLVAVWQDSTDCFGDPISRNAWVTDSGGSVFTESDLSGPATQNFGDMGGRPLNEPIVGMTPTSDGQGYWEVASDGGIFAFGDAGFHGSMGGQPLNQPIAGMAVTADGGGYWLVANDGGIFSFGDAGFYGSMGGTPLNEPIEAMVPTPDGGGYWMVSSDGGIFAFGDAPFYGSTGGMVLPSPISGMIPNGSGGYTLVAEDGTEYPFGP